MRHCKILKGINIIILLLITFTFFACNNKRNKIDEFIIPNITEIGTLFDVEHVEESTRIPVDNTNRGLLSLSTREIFTDPDTGEEYYIADYNHPIIKGGNAIYNDVESFIKVVSHLEKEADYYLKDASLKEKNNEILAYMRTTNIEYDTSIWKAVCGGNSKLRECLSTLETGGLEFSEYFAAFLDKDLFNIELYPITKEKYINAHLYLIDPILKEPIIDLIHFIGAFDGTCLNTGDSLSSLPFSVLEKKYYQMVVSWAGDLQTCAERLEYFNLSDITFEDILKRDDLTFDMPDLIADIDATNLGLNLNLASVDSLSQLFSNYFYDFVIAGKSRVKRFIESVSIQSGFTKGTNEEKFINLTYEMLKLDSDGNEYTEGSSLANIGKYYYLRNSDSKICDISYRKHLAEIFIHYFLDNK